jgi:hypothetical protein
MTPRTGPGSAIWMRVTVHNAAPAARLGILADTYSYTDLVDCWTELSDGRWEHLLSGQARSGAEKPLWSRSPAFPISVPGRSGQIVYLRASDYYFSELKLEWWPRAEDFFSNQLRNTLLECMCYGALIALLLYNLVLWLRLRYPDTGYYLLYGGALATFNFVSNGGPTLLGWPSGSPANEIIIYAALLVSGIFVAQFARVFLNTASSVPLGHRALPRNPLDHCRRFPHRGHPLRRLGRGRGRLAKRRAPGALFHRGLRAPGPGRHPHGDRVADR